MSDEDLAASLGRLIERVDLYESSDEGVECIIPFADGLFLDEDIDKEVFFKEIARGMEQLGIPVGDVVGFIDDVGNEHPLALPVRRLSWHAHYLLDAQGQPVPTNDLRAASRLLSDGKARTVAKTSFVAHGKHVEVSTVFLVFNHAYLPGQEPVLWESMVFTNFRQLNKIQMRYTSKSEALQGHRWLVAYTRKFMGADGWPRRRRKPTIHQAAAMLRRQRRVQRKRGAR